MYCHLIFFKIQRNISYTDTILELKEITSTKIEFKLLTENEQNSLVTFVKIMWARILYEKVIRYYMIIYDSI